MFKYFQIRTRFDLNRISQMLLAWWPSLIAEYDRIVNMKMEQGRLYAWRVIKLYNAVNVQSSHLMKETPADRCNAFSVSLCT